MAHLAENHYGKSRVRLLRVTRNVGGNPASHHVDEWTVGVYLTGDFNACYVAGDNSGLLATDTMKNTVYAVARGTTAGAMELFALELGQFLLDRNPQVLSARITLEEKTWVGIKETAPGGGRASHESAFLQRGPELHTTTVVLGRREPPVIISGVKGLVILKTSHSAFAGFKRDELTTLPETHDRLLGTEATMEWLYGSPPEDFTATRHRVMDTLLSTFAQHDSLSVQQTLYAMAEAALAAEPLLAEMTLTMPNRHNLPVDFSRFLPPFDFSNDNTIFVPTDEPHGQIQARVVR